jgi:hypothetical protein
MSTFSIGDIVYVIITNEIDYVRSQEAEIYSAEIFSDSIDLHLQCIGAGAVTRALGEVFSTRWICEQEIRKQLMSRRDSYMKCLDRINVALAKLEGTSDE